MNYSNYSNYSNYPDNTHVQKQDIRRLKDV